MKYCIVGAGALGTITAAMLIQAGHEVRLVARGTRARQLREAGLKVSGLVNLHLKCDVETEPGDIKAADVLIFAVKTYHMDEALAGLAHVRPEHTFSLANGVMKNEQLAGAYGANRVHGCMANFSGEMTADGEVLFTRNVLLALGAGASSIAGEIDQAGIKCGVVDNIETVEWSKYVGWVALFVLSLISRQTTGQFLDNRHFARLGSGVIREMAVLAFARDVKLIDQSPLPVASVANAGEDEAIELLREVGRNMQRDAPDHRMSSLQDLTAGRVLEVHETLGFALRESQRLGLDAPLLESCYEISAGLNPDGAD